MEFEDVVLRRRMVRDFSDEPIARPLLDQLMANATRGGGAWTVSACPVRPAITSAS